MATVDEMAIAGWPQLTPREVAELVMEMLLVRKGQVIDESVARERANNIAAALSRTVVK